MSVSKWAYIPEKCDGDFCPGDCDVCSKTEENMTNEEAIRALNHIRGAIRNGIQPTRPGKAIEGVDFAISALERDRWIPVTEKLPEPKTEVMAAFDDGAVYSLWQKWQNDTCEPFTYTVDDFFGPTHDVTHWKPLPEPPKEET